MSQPRFVEEYLTALDPVKGETLRTIIEFILEEFPPLDSKLAWNVPQIHRDRDYVFGVSSLKNHLDLAPWSQRVIEDFRERLEQGGLVVRKNLFQVPDDWAVDTELLRDLVQARLAELD